MVRKHRRERRQDRGLRRVCALHSFPAEVLRAIHDDDPVLLDDCIAGSFDLLDICDAGGSTLLHLAARFNALKVAKYLFDHWSFPVVEQWDFDGWTPVHEAVSGGHVEMIRLLYDAGVDLESATFNSGGDGDTPLTLAMQIAEGCGVDPAKDPTVRTILALIRPKGSAR